MKEWEMNGMEIRDVKDTKNKIFKKRIEKLTGLFYIKINIFYHIFKKEKEKARPSVPCVVSHHLVGDLFLTCSAMVSLCLWYTLHYPSFHLPINPSLFRPQP